MFGPLEELIVCENTNDRKYTRNILFIFLDMILIVFMIDLKGNVYARFKYENDAQKAMDNFNTRWYNGRPVYCELSPVTDFREACCRQHDTRSCSRGGYCNFIHAKRPPRQLVRELELSQKKYLKSLGRDEHSDESPSPSPERQR